MTDVDARKVSKPKRKNGQSDGLVAENRRARRDYTIEGTFECGIELVGSEVKSLRAKQASISDAYAIVKKGELFLVGLKINRFRNQSTHTAPEQGRTRKLLANKKEIEEMDAAVSVKGCSLVPLRIYFKGSWAKVLLGVAKGRTYEDRREDVKEREAFREMARAITRHGAKRLR